MEAEHWMVHGGGLPDDVLICFLLLESVSDPTHHFISSFDVGLITLTSRLIDFSSVTIKIHEEFGWVFSDCFT